MKRLTAALLVVLWLLVPVAPRLQTTFRERTANVQDEALEEYMENSLGFFVFDILTQVFDPFTGQFYQGAGTAFILEGFTVTATHVTEIYSDLLKDVKILGRSPLFGHRLCDHDHEEGDLLYYHSRREGKKILILEEKDDIFIIGTGPVPPLQGESGSPVFCDAHNKVVGLVTAILLEGSPWPGGTLISRITRDMLVYEPKKELFLVK